MTGIQIRDLPTISDLMGDELFPADTSAGKTGNISLSKTASYAVSLHKREQSPHPEYAKIADLADVVRQTELSTSLTTVLNALSTALTAQIDRKQASGDYALNADLATTRSLLSQLQASLGSAAFLDASALKFPRIRASSTVVTANLKAGQIGNYSVPLAKTFKLLRIEVSSQCRTRIYSSPAARASDVSRPPLTDQDSFPAGIGLIAEVNLIGQLSIDLDNLTGSSMEATPSENFAIAVTNNSSLSAAITLTLHYLKLED